MKVLALIFEGFEEEEAIAPFALLRRVGVDLTIASNKTTVNGSHNISLTNIKLINEINYQDYDCLIIPGGAHYKFLKKSELVHSIINYYFNNNKIVCGICAAPTIFGMLGHLKNKNYTCFTSMNEDFKGIYHNTGVVIDGNLITAKSVAYSIEFAYAIIEKLYGKAKLEELFKHIYYEK
ncbi:MAG: DJ-1/PfpI family protein [Anaeroplasma sp.]